MIFILDCSVTMAWFIEDEVTSFTDKIQDSLYWGNQAIVPSVWKLEVANVFLMAERRKRISTDNTHRFLDLLKILPITVEEVPTFAIMHDILKTAREYHLSMYDAAYLELAIRKRFPLVTLDKELLTAARKSRIQVLDEISF